MQSRIVSTWLKFARGGVSTRLVFGRSRRGGILRWGIKEDSCIRNCLLLTLFLTMLLAGCAGQPRGRADLLDFLQEATTCKEQVYLTLGDPSMSYEGGRIVTYRLGKNKGGYYLLQNGPDFQGVNYSLVLVFSEQGCIAKHSLVEVRRP